MEYTEDHEDGVLEDAGKHSDGVMEFSENHEGGVLEDAEKPVHGVLEKMSPQ